MKATCTPGGAHTYRVVVTPHDGDLCADVPELPGVHTFAQDEASLDGHVREAIALWLDLPEGAESTLSLAYEQQRP